MSMNNHQIQDRQKILEKLNWSGRKESRASLLFRHAVAEKAGVHVTDAECIDFLLEAGSASPGDLAKATGISTGAMTTAIDRLERAGYVTRERDVQDRRKVIVKPVMVEIGKFVPLYESMVRELGALFSQYTTEELQFLVRHNSRMAEIYENETLKIKQDESPERIPNL